MLQTERLGSQSNDCSFTAIAGGRIDVRLWGSSNSYVHKNKAGRKKRQYVGSGKLLPRNRESRLGTALVVARETRQESAPKFPLPCSGLGRDPLLRGVARVRFAKTLSIRYQRLRSPFHGAQNRALGELPAGLSILRAAWLHKLTSCWDYSLFLRHISKTPAEVKRNLGGFCRCSLTR